MLKDVTHEKKVDFVNDAINKGFHATLNSHARNKGLTIDRITYGYTAKIKNWRFVYIYEEDLDRLYELASKF